MRHLFSLALNGIIILSMAGAIFAARPPAPPMFFWTTVVNNNDAIPDVEPRRNFNSYNSPSVSGNGVVVFRARSRGGTEHGPATHGIYTRDMAVKGDIVRVLDRSTPVPASRAFPDPDYLSPLFIETPAFPRIDRDWDTVITRGNHPPVYRYTPEGETETRIGTSGIYVRTPGGDLFTGAAKLGTVPDLGFFSVPGLEPALSFDVFPGAPAVTDGTTLVFKGNYTIGEGHETGVFYRDLDGESEGTLPVLVIADTLRTVIPGTDRIFGSLSPPSAGNSLAVFAGFDNEQEPTLGGLYMAPIAPEPKLTPLIRIGSPVPDGSAGDAFMYLGEGSSFDGRFVGFWGAWGSETHRVPLYCPEEGSKDRRDFCNNTGAFAEGNGDPNSVCDDDTDGTDRCYQEKWVPANQGIFVHDVRKGKTVMVARTFTGTGFDDFLFWSYSGKVPGVGGGHHGEEGGEDDGEPARWRSSALVAVSEGAGQSFQTAFKARRGEVSGIYLGFGQGRDVLTVLDTTMEGRTLDPDALTEWKITEVGLEREGFRNGWLVINARMGMEGGTEEEGLAGIYLAKVPNIP